MLPWLLSADCTGASITSAAWHCRGQRTGCDLPAVTKVNWEQKHHQDKHCCAIMQILFCYGQSLMDTMAPEVRDLNVYADLSPE